MGCIVLLVLAVPGRAVRAEVWYMQERIEVDILIREYYKACSEGDTERAKQLIAMKPYEEEILGKWAKACGVERYDVLMVEAYWLRENSDWVIYVEYNMILEDTGVAIPGSAGYLLHRGEDGWEDYSSRAGDLEEEIAAVTQGEHYSGRVADVNRRYNEVLEAHPELQEWPGTLTETIRRGMLGEAEPEAEEADAASYYEVQRGDCLWNIAREKLGSGLEWPILYEENRDVIGKDSNLIWIGTKLRIRQE